MVDGRYLKKNLHFSTVVQGIAQKFDRMTLRSTLNSITSSKFKNLSTGEYGHLKLYVSNKTTYTNDNKKAIIR